MKSLIITLLIFLLSYVNASETLDEPTQEDYKSTCLSILYETTLTKKEEEIFVCLGDIHLTS